MIEVLAGTPSILLGIVALFLLVVYLKPITGGESLLAGAIALAALVSPVIERATEDAIERVPWELEEGELCTRCNKMADDPEHHYSFCILRDYYRGNIGFRQSRRGISSGPFDGWIFSGICRNS